VSGKIKKFPEKCKGYWLPDEYDSEEIKEWCVKTKETLEKLDYIAWVKDNLLDKEAYDFNEGGFEADALCLANAIEVFVNKVLLESLKSE